MDVIKKSNEQEKFSYAKLAASVHAANANTGEELDIELLLGEFQNLVMEKDFITTGQINAVVYGLLYSKNAMRTLANYAGFKAEQQPEAPAPAN